MHPKVSTVHVYKQGKVDPYKMHNLIVAKFTRPRCFDYRPKQNLDVVYITCELFLLVVRKKDSMTVSVFHKHVNVVCANMHRLSSWLMQLAQQTQWYGDTQLQRHSSDMLSKNTCIVTYLCSSIRISRVLCRQVYVSHQSLAKH